MPAVLAGARIRKKIVRHRGQAERIVGFAIGEQPGVGGHDRTAKLKHQPSVEIESERLAIRFTLRVRHGRQNYALIVEFVQTNCGSSGECGLRSTCVAWSAAGLYVPRGKIFPALEMALAIVEGFKGANEAEEN
jgi:hypothetical protein